MKVTFYSTNMFYKYIAVFSLKQIKKNQTDQTTSISNNPNPLSIEYLFDKDLPTWDYIDVKERKKLKMVALGLGTYHFTYKNAPFQITIRTYTDPILATEHGELTYEMTLDIQDQDEPILYDFIDEARETIQDEMSLLGRANKETIRKYMYEMDGRYGDWIILNISKKRSIDTLFLEPSIIDNLKTEINTFMDPSTKEEYERFGIPYKFNVLLYGLPGTGKTTTIHCIASLIHSDIAILQITKDIDDSNLTKAINSLSKLDNCRVLVLEDIDSIFSDERKVHDSTKNGITMSGILNFLDGLVRNEGIIVFITTNNKDVLDEAIFRTGRIDLQYRYTHAKEEQVKQMLKYYFPAYEKQLIPAFYEKVQYLEFTVADLQSFLFKNRKKPLDILKNYKDILLQKEDSMALSHHKDLYM